MKRHATTDDNGTGSATGEDHDIEMATAKTDEVLDASHPVDANLQPGFHKSLGTVNTRPSVSQKPAPFLRDESYKRVSGAPVPFGSLAEAFSFTVFLVLFLLATAVVGRDKHAFFFADRVKAVLVDRDFEVSIQQDSVLSTTQKRFVGILDQGDVFAFLQGPFVDAVYGTSLSDDASDKAAVMLSYNRLLGGVRLRSLRVKPDSCPVLKRMPEYSSLVSFCYGRFTPGYEQKDGFGPILNRDPLIASLCFQFAKTFFADKETTKTYNDLTTCNSDCDRACGDRFGVERFRYTAQCTAQCSVYCKCVYEQPVGFSNLCVDPNPNGPGAEIPTPVFSYNWSSSDETGAGHARGYATTFPGSGYVVDLPLDGASAARILQEMKQNRFLDLATRVLFVDFTIYNPYFQFFNIVHLAFEFPATGGVFASFSDVVIDMFRYSTPSDTARIVLELVVVAFVLWRWKNLLVKWYTMGIRTYMAYDRLWHTIETLHLIMFLGVIGFRLFVIDRSYGTLSGQVAKSIDAASPSEIPAFHSFAYIQDIDALLNSINAGLVWLQFLKYTQMSKRICLLLRTLRRASGDLLWFLVYLMTCIFGFAQMGFLLFNFHVDGFRTLGASIVTLLQAVAGDLDYIAITQAHQTLGPIYYVMFYLLLILIVLNVFLAIINDAYAQTMSEQEEEEEAEEAALIRSESTTMDGNISDIEAQLRRLERRELEQLRKYPFSKGLRPAAKLLVADLKRALYELRTGKKMFKVDPMVAGMMGVVSADSVGSRAHGGNIASRKLTIQVKRQLEKQMQLQEAAREAKRSQEEREQREENEAKQNELTQRLGALIDSNKEKAKRMEELEETLGTIEKLCQQLVTATMEDLPASPKRPTTTALAAGGGAAARPLTGSTALAMALQRQKTAGKKGSLKNGTGEADIEEITL